MLTGSNKQIKVYSEDLNNQYLNSELIWKGSSYLLGIQMVLRRYSAQFSFSQFQRVYWKSEKIYNTYAVHLPMKYPVDYYLVIFF